jgi:hypothetical protein
MRKVVININQIIFLMRGYFVNIRKIVCQLSVVTFAFLISCHDNVVSDAGTPSISEAESSLTEQETKVLFRMREPGNRVSFDEITRLTDDIIGILDGESALKSGSGRRVNSMAVLLSDSRPALKSSDFGDIEFPDTLAYIINFSDSLGFVIISADTRVDDPILAFTGSGSLIDEIDNPGIAIFLERLEDYILNSIVEAEQQRDYLLEGIMEKLSDESSTKAVLPIQRRITVKEISREIIAQITPLVLVEWDQGRPYNNNMGGQCNNETGNNKHWAGCVAVAVAHIMSHWKHPPAINGHFFDWTELNKYTGGWWWWRVNTYPNAANRHMDNAPANVKNQVANLFDQIGRGVGMSYGCNGSSAPTSNSVDFLSRLGFRTEGVRGYNSGVVIASLNSRRPLMAVGCSERKTFLGITTSHSGCHQWVIDGYLRYQIISVVTITNSQTGTIISQETNYAYPEYLHNNWGWYGDRNGYFAVGVFDANQTPISSSTTKSDKKYNFQYKIEIVPNIHR